MTKKHRYIPDIVCAEAIAFLYALHDVPAKPSVNSWQPQTQPSNLEYALPFDKERDLVSTLAFLSNISEDPSHVPALCIHEQPGNGVVEVIIAVNQACYGDGRSNLERIQTGFDRIFQLLSGVCQLPGAEKAVFRAIVTMCSLRIRERMRYAPNKRNQKKQNLKQLLEEASLLLDDTYPEFGKQARTVVKSIDRWFNHRTDQQLCDLIESIALLSCNRELPQMLSWISNTHMGPSERRNLLKMIRRVARYREAARLLYRTAKKYPIARGLQVVLVSLPQHAFPPPVAGGYQPDFPRVCARLQIAHGRQSDIARITSLLGQNGQSAEAIFTDQCMRTLREGKVHAEVQIVYYLETEQLKPRPRVVASSKMACFLCDIFLRQAAKLYTKRCHGRLYPAWKLPVFPPSSGLERLFLQALENYIRKSAATLLRKQGRTLFPQPSESTLWTMDVSTTTLSTDPGPESILEESPGLESSSHIGREAPAIQAFEPIPVESTGPYINTQPSWNRMDLLEVLQGSAAAFALGAFASAPVQIGRLFIQLEYSIGIPRSIGSKLQCNVEWLTRDEGTAAEDANNVHVVDVESLTDEIAIPAPDLEALYIAVGRDIVRLSITS